ncbi:MAG: SdrD B-like domain-containing protein [Actinomycetaceae bacterium]|nr:SdrD B-like domain-containing protein [Actinomycetaceae bacterium]
MQIGAVAEEDKPSNGLAVNTDWEPRAEAWNNYSYNVPRNHAYRIFLQKGLGAVSAVANVGDVHVTASLKQLPDNKTKYSYLLGAAGITTTQKAGANANTHFAFDESLANAEGLSIMVPSALHCFGEEIPFNKVADALNYDGICDMAELTFTFDRPVSDPIIDFTGIGGGHFTRSTVVKIPELDPAFLKSLADSGKLNDWFVERIFARGTYANQIFTLQTEGATLKRLDPAPEESNLVVTDKTVDLRKFNAMGTCTEKVSNRVIPIPDNAWPGGKRPEQLIADAPLEHEKSGCGSVMVKGENLTKVTFKVSARFSPFSKYFPKGFGGKGEPGELWNVSRERGLAALDDSKRRFTGRPDGVNGAFWPIDLPLPVENLFHKGDQAFKDGSIADFYLDIVPATTVADLATVNVRLPDYTIAAAVWIDDNYNGLKESGEKPQVSTKVELLDGENNVLATTTTDAEGKYVFRGLSHGVDYRVRIAELPANYVVTQKGAADAENTSKAEPATRTTDVIRFSRDAHLTDPSAAAKQDKTQNIGIVKIAPALTVTKQINGQDANTEADAVSVAPGAEMKISVKIENTGNVPLQEIIFADDFLPADAFTARGTFSGTLLPGESVWFDAVQIAPADPQSLTGKITVTAKAYDFNGKAIVAPANPGSTDFTNVSGSNEAHANVTAKPSEGTTPGKQPGEDGKQPGGKVTTPAKPLTQKQLPLTGMQVGGFLTAAGLLLALGAFSVAATKRRR